MSAASATSVQDSRPAAYYYTPSYKGAPRVVLLVGTAWKPNMRAHYGLDGEALFTRVAYPGEPSHFEGSRHPFGWVFPPEGALRYEKASGMGCEQVSHLARLLRERLAATPFETPSQQQAWLDKLAAAEREDLPKGLGRPGAREQLGQSQEHPELQEA